MKEKSKPFHGRFFKSLCSGGQKRRVSLAIALIHNPDLIILDEPTVGVDPLLRQKIWSYLVNLSLDQGKSILITTHYIEEARRANVIGLMRQGRLLAEDSPMALLAKYERETLEDVFVNLCSKDENESAKSLQSVRTVFEDTGVWTLSYSPKQKSSQVQLFQLPPDPKAEVRPKRWCPGLSLPSSTTLLALVIKNLIKMIRNPTTLILILILPMLEVVVFSVAIGKDPKDLPIGKRSFSAVTYLITVQIASIL